MSGCLVFCGVALGILSSAATVPAAEDVPAALRAFLADAEIQAESEAAAATDPAGRAAAWGRLGMLFHANRLRLRAIESYTRALAAELGKDKINVNSIAPGNVATPLNAHVRGPGNEEYVELMKTFTPTGIDFMDPDDMTGTAVFLATEDSRMIHGETIIVDAGWSVW